MLGQALPAILCRLLDDRDSIRSDIAAASRRVDEHELATATAEHFEQSTGP
ncbi:MAG: hypothetical protein ACI9SE_003021, partial [Neolewinella sp.]